MKYMFCYNKVIDYKRWRTIFDSHKEAHVNAGLKLINIFRSIESENEIYFIFEISEIIKAKEYVTNHESEVIGKAAGVLEGTIQYLDEIEGN